MIAALAHRGFGYGSGVVDPEKKIFIANIPKNASSYIWVWAKHHGWNTTLATNVPDVKEMIVLLRDPVSRWISGVAQYVNTYILSVHGPNGPVMPDEPLGELDYVMDAIKFIDQYTDVTERVIFDNAARLDDHVWPQCEIVENLLPNARRRYFSVDGTLNDCLCAYLGWRAVPGIDRNSGRDNQNIAQLQEFFRQRLDQRPELLGRLKKQYQQDYELIQRVLPYGS